MHFELLAPPAGRREIVRSVALPDVRECLDAIGFVRVAKRRMSSRHPGRI
jgi:hypothetical protein